MTAISMVNRARIEVFVSKHFKSPAWGASELYGSIAKNITDAFDEIIIMHLDFKEENRDKLMSHCNQLLDALKTHDTEATKEGFALTMLENTVRTIKSEHRKPVKLVLPHGGR